MRYVGTKSSRQNLGADQVIRGRFTVQIQLAHMPEQMKRCVAQFLLLGRNAVEQTLDRIQFVRPRNRGLRWWPLVPLFNAAG